MRTGLALFALVALACAEPLGPSWHRRTFTLCELDLTANTFACRTVTCEVFGYRGGRFWEWRDCR